MSLRISRVRARVLRVPLVEPFAITTATMGECEHVVVTVETDGGIEGQGSVSTIPAFMGETATLIAAAIGFLEPVVVGHDPFDIEAVVEDMDDAIQDNHSAKAAIDFACHDLMGKALGLPVHKLIGGLYRERIPLTWVIGIKPVEQTVAEAIARFADGYRVFKIKVGHDDGDDVEKVRLVREALGPEAIIRLDANTAYSADRGVRVLSRLEPFTLEMIEQPCRKADLKGMARIRDALHTPILADESASGLEEVRLLIDMGAADIINIKLGKVGGLHTAQDRGGGQGRRDAGGRRVEHGARSWHGRRGAFRRLDPRGVLRERFVRRCAAAPARHRRRCLGPRGDDDPCPERTRTRRPVARRRAGAGCGGLIAI